MKRRTPAARLIGDTAIGPVRYEKVSAEDLSVLVRMHRLRVKRGRTVVLN